MGDKGWEALVRAIGKNGNRYEPTIPGLGSHHGVCQSKACSNKATWRLRVPGGRERSCVNQVPVVRSECGVRGMAVLLTNLVRLVCFVASSAAGQLDRKTSRVGQSIKLGDGVIWETPWQFLVPFASKSSLTKVLANLFPFSSHQNHTVVKLSMTYDFVAIPVLNCNAWKWHTAICTERNSQRKCLIVHKLMYFAPPTFVWRTVSVWLCILEDNNSYCSPNTIDYAERQPPGAIPY